MLEPMQLYFGAEKSESLLFVVIGLAALFSGMALLAARTRVGPFLHGVAYPLVAVAMIQVAVGGSVYLRTDAQLAALTTQFEQAPARVAGQERARMDRVNRNFEIYKRIEIALLLGGAACVALGLSRTRRMLGGIGCGLIVQGGFMLVLDFFAGARAAVYTAALLAL